MKLKLIGFSISAALVLCFVNCSGGFSALLGNKTGLVSSDRASLPRLTSAFGNPTAEAAQAWKDYQTYFWDSSGHIATTSDGTPGSGFPGSFWQRTLYMFDLVDYANLTGSADLKAKVASEWAYVQAEWKNAGYGTSVYGDCTTSGRTVSLNDDAGWAALYYIAVYNTLGDANALSYAKTMVTCSYSYFDAGNGMLKYDRSNPNWANSYEVGLMTAAYEIYQATGDTSFRDLAMRTYSWMQSKMQRTDGLYWGEWSISGGYPDWFMDKSPASQHADDFLPGQGVSSLEMNMAMAVMNARLYREAGDDSYRLLAIATMKGLINVASNSQGVLADDRDGWIDAAFATRFAREAVTLTGAPPLMKTVLFNTAASIMSSARTSDGHYRADWDGGTNWTDASVANATTDGGMCGPQQIMTNAQSVGLVLAAATLTISHPVIGAISAASGNTIGGWACASGWTPSIEIDVYAGSSADTATLIYSSTANTSTTAAVNTSCGADGSHGFVFTLDSTIASAYDGQSIFIYGISPVQGDNVLLGGSGNFQLSAALAATSVSTALVTDSSGAALANGATYTISSIASGQCIDVPGGKLADGVRMQQYDCIASDPNQQFIAHANSDGSWSFESTASGKYLDFVYQTLPADGTLLQQWDNLSSTNQSFLLSSSNGGYQLALSMVPTSCMDFRANALGVDGATIQLYSCNLASNQAFKFSRQ